MSADIKEKEQNVITENVKKVKKRGRKLYWFIVIVGTVIIMSLSINIGFNIDKIFNPKSNVKKDNQTEQKNLKDDDIVINLLTEDEALNLGNQLYNDGKLDFYNKIHTKDGCISATVNGEYYMDCTDLYNGLEKHFAKDNKVGRSSSTMNDIYIDFIEKNSDGKKYLDTTGENFVGEVKTSLSIHEISESQIVFNASSIVLVPDSSNVLVVDRTEENEFVIVREDDKWKISYFVVLGV